MPPADTLFYKIDHPKMNAITIGNTSVAAGGLKYFDCLFVRKNRTAVLLSWLLDSTLPPLCDLVGNVVVIRAKEQMVWIDADWIVTLMERPHSSGNWAFGNDPCSLVGADDPPVEIYLAVSTSAARANELDAAGIGIEL